MTKKGNKMMNALVGLVVAVSFYSTINTGTECSKIAIMPTGIGSPYFILVKIGETLKERGHEVTIFVSNEVRKQRSKVDHHLYNVDLPKHLDEKVMIKRMMSGGGVRTFEFIPTLVELDMFNCEAIFKDGTVMQKLQKQDIIIGTSASFCGSLIAEYLKLPHILIHPAVFTALASLFMVPLPPSYVPVMQTASTDQMTFMERLKNVFFVAGQEILFRFVFLPMFKPFQQKHNILPDKDVGELLGSAEMHLVQLDFAIEYAHPLMPNTVYVGPLTANPPDDLPEHLNTIMENSGKYGVIVVSFGSHISELPEKTLKSMVDAFGRLKQTVVWKVQFSSDTKLNPNIKPFKWLPQNDLLGHRNTKAFISHLGSNGVNEAAYHGIPVIAAPFMTDGYDNYLRLATKGKMAKFIDVYGANSDTWLRTIEEVIYDPSYKSNASRVSKLIRSFPRSSRDRAADLVEYVLDNGGRVPHLRAYAYNLKWYQYHNLDAIAFLILTAIVAMFLNYKLFKFCFRLICKCKRNKNKHE